MATTRRTKQRRTGLSQQKANFTSVTPQKDNSRLYKWIAFLVIDFLILLVLFLLGIILVSPDDGLNAYGTALEKAVYRNQEVVEQYLNVGIIRYREFNIDELEVGLEVLVYDELRDEGQYLWVQEIIAIDLINGEVELRFNDYLVSQTVSIDDIQYTYVRDANLLGRMIYVAGQPRGYVFVICIALLIVSGTYFALIYEKKE